MKRHAVIDLKYLPTPPLRSLWLAWALWVSHRIHPLPGWVLGTCGTLIAIAFVGGWVAFWMEDEKAPNEIGPEAQP